VNIVSQYQNELIIIFALISLIELFWILGLNISFKKTKKRFNRFTRGEGKQNLGQLFEEYNQEIDSMQSDISILKEESSHLFKRVDQLKGKVGMVRYNAFGEQGNDLSYSIAILDDQQNGIVITSIYNREQSNSYAKPIEKGTSSYRLSEEEKNAIQKALMQS